MRHILFDPYFCLVKIKDIFRDRGIRVFRVPCYS